MVLNGIVPQLALFWIHILVVMMDFVPPIENPNLSLASLSGKYKRQTFCKTRNGKSRGG